MNVAKATGKLKQQIQLFSGKLSAGLPKVVSRFVEDGMHGIQARQSLRLSEWGRSLGERIPLGKTINRLSRQLDREGLWDELSARIVALGAEKIGERTLLIVDTGDLTKRYAREMEYLGLVRDGSAGELASGYWTMQVVGCETLSNQIVPLYHRLYSTQAPDSEGENAEIIKAVRTVGSGVGKRGVWVIDRGGDRGRLYDYFLTHNHRFLIRLKGDRYLVHQGRKIIARELAESCPLPHGEMLVREESQREKSYQLTFGGCQVRLPDFPQALWMLVVKGFGAKPMMLLTNLPLRQNRADSLWMLRSYLTRWKIEETIRFIKQSYAVEDVRVMTYRRLQNMMALVLAVSYFTMAYLGQRLKLKAISRLLLEASRRIFGIPDFRFYALADGIKALLQRSDKGPLRSPPPQTANSQIPLFST